MPQSAIQPANFSNAQLAILELFASNLSESELENLHQTLLKFRYERLQKLLDEQWDSGEISGQKLDEWSREHLRTPYKSQQHFQAQTTVQ